MTRRRTPPAVLNGGRLLAYAVLKRGTRNAMPGRILVGGRPLLRVSALAITDAPPIGKAPKSRVLLLFCSDTWFPKALEGFHSVAAAKGQAERMYPGSSALWVASKVTKDQAERYLRKVWAGQECTFCNRRPDQVQQMIVGKSGRICDKCIAECNTILRQSGSRGGA
jgi:hypothetical protein